MTADPVLEQPQPVVSRTVAATAWLVPVAALLAVIGALLAWFRPRVASRARTFDAIYSVKDKAGLVVPLALVLLSISIVGLVLGKPRGRLAGSSDPVRLAGWYCIATGLGCAVAVAVAWAMVPSLYSFDVAGRRLSWDQYQQAGLRLDRGPAAGFWLSCAAAALALVSGVLLVLGRRGEPSAGT